MVASLHARLVQWVVMYKYDNHQWVRVRTTSQAPCARSGHTALCHGGLLYVGVADNHWMFLMVWGIDVLMSREHVKHSKRKPTKPINPAKPTKPTNMVLPNVCSNKSSKRDYYKN